MKTKIIHLSLALLTLTGATAQPDGEPEGHRPPPVPPLFALFDADRDGIISAAEIEASPESLVTLDKNEDGVLTPQELQPRRPRPPHREEAPDGRRPNGPPPEDEPSFDEE